MQTIQMPCSQETQITNNDNPQDQGENCDTITELMHSPNMDLYKRIFEEGNFHLKPFPHWIIVDFFDPEDLKTISQYFPSSKEIFRSLEKDIKFLLSSKNSIGAENLNIDALARLGIREEICNFEPEVMKKVLEEKAKQVYEPLVSYALQMGQCCTPINPEYSGITSFDNIIRRLELDWWESRERIVKKLNQIASFKIPKNMDIISRGDLRAASPGASDNKTILGPHLDSETELFAGLIYLKSPLDDSDGSNLILYELIDQHPKKYMSKHRRIPMKYIKPYKTIKYGYNNAVFFINSPESIHSVSARSNSKVDRRSINLSLECPARYGIFNKKAYVSDELDKYDQYGKYQNIKTKLL